MIIYKFLDKVYGFADDNKYREAIDIIFQHINTLLLGKDFYEVNEILGEIDLTQLPPVLMISFLTF